VGEITFGIRTTLDLPDKVERRESKAKVQQLSKHRQNQRQKKLDTDYLNAVQTSAVSEKVFFFAFGFKCQKRYFFKHTSS
jgi:hypothetical protein